MVWDLKGVDRMNEIEKIIMNIKSYNKITDIFILYNMDREIFVIRDKINNLPINHFINFSEDKFKQFITELNKLSLWKNDYEFEMRVIKY